MRQSVVLLLVVLFGASLVAQASDAMLRETIRTVPSLDMERTVVPVDSAVKLEGISAVTADPSGNLYVVHRPTGNGDPIVVLDRAGKLLRSWGRGLFDIPHGIRIDSAGNVWVTESSKTSKLVKFSSAGQKLLEIDISRMVPAHGVVRRDDNPPQVGATDIAFGPNGTVYLADGYQNARVLVFNAEGQLIREWGRPGNGPGEFQLPHGIAITNGKVYVADRENGRLQWFDLSGKFEGQWVLGGQFYNIAFAPDGGVWASAHPKDVPLEQEFYVVRLDPATGRPLGKIEVRSHELAVAPDGALLPATRGTDLLIFRARQHQN
jgi:DNA-binding beta-propeller fold protein YncE